MWIWEGVTMYLHPEAIAGTLAQVRALSAPGSRLAVTYLPPGAARLMASVIGEPLHGLLDRESMARLLDDAGFERISDESTHEWAARYWPPRAAATVRARERLAIAERR